MFFCGRFSALQAKKRRRQITAPLYGMGHVTAALRLVWRRLGLLLLANVLWLALCLPIVTGYGRHSWSVLPGRAHRQGGAGFRATLRATEATSGRAFASMACAAACWG